MPMFDVGDRILIRADLEETQRHPCVNDIMVRYRGREAVVRDILYQEHYVLSVDDGRWEWADWMIEPFTQSELEEDYRVDQPTATAYSPMRLVVPIQCYSPKVWYYRFLGTPLGVREHSETHYKLTDADNNNINDITRRKKHGRYIRKADVVLHSDYQEKEKIVAKIERLKATVYREVEDDDWGQYQRRLRVINKLTKKLEGMI